MGIDGVPWLLRAFLIDASAGGIERVDERAHVPDVHFAGLGPARDVIWPRWRGEGLPRGERLSAYSIHAAKVWDGAVIEGGVLVQVVLVVLVVTVRVIALWQCKRRVCPKSGRGEEQTAHLHLFVFYAAASS